VRAVRDAHLAEAWAKDALSEHASVASFARFALDLMALGAPADLVADAHRAALDEIEHARLSFALASRYAGETIGPGPLATDGAVARADLIAAAVAAAIEGCIGETEAALLAEAQLAGAKDARVRRALARIARDEADHAALAWRFVAWAIDEGGERVRREVARVFEMPRVDSESNADDTPCVDPATWRAHGRLTREEIARVRDRARREVIDPCARALLGSLRFATRAPSRGASPPRTPGGALGSLRFATRASEPARSSRSRRSDRRA
jgi:hypothetical protein